MAVRLIIHMTAGNPLITHSTVPLGNWTIIKQMLRGVSILPEEKRQYSFSPFHYFLRYSEE